MRDRVVAALGLLPAAEQVVGVRVRVRAAGRAPGRFQGADEAGAEDVEIGHGGILPPNGPRHLAWVP
jgi:hypothetical protein